MYCTKHAPTEVVIGCGCDWVVSNASAPTTESSTIVNGIKEGDDMTKRTVTKESSIDKTGVDAGGNGYMSPVAVVYNSVVSSAGLYSTGWIWLTNRRWSVQCFLLMLFFIFKY